mgnify:CR=1 FL=1
MVLKKKTVLKSINMHGEGVCVDFFQRVDGSFGFEEYRRDFEDARGWFPIGSYSRKSFTSLDEAKQTALLNISWLREEAGNLEDF